MTIQEYRQILAEQTALQNLLDRLPSSRVIERRGLEFRKRKVDEILASRPPVLKEPAHVRVTFRGKPVVGSRGLLADFGAAAVKAFADAVAVVGASRDSSLKFRGAIPQKEKYGLLITGTASGSFGFELEETPGDGRFPEMSPVGPAVKRTMSILEAAVGSDDEMLLDTVFDAHPRALRAIRTFLNKMAVREATCALEFKGRTLRFSDVSEVRRVERRLGSDHVLDEEQQMTGRFLGVLPSKRRFEFRNEDTGRVVSGRIDPALKDAGAINEVLNRPTRVTVVARRVGSAGSRYVLLAYQLARDLRAGSAPWSVVCHSGGSPPMTRPPCVHGYGGEVSDASSRKRQKGLARRICSGVRQGGIRRAGLATMAATQRAREVATLRRWRL